jgi:hypothetical protein
LTSLKYGFYLRCFTTIIMLLLRRTSIIEILRNPRQFLRVPFFLGLQSFIFKLSLCLIRRFRGKSDADGLNPFLSGCLSGLSILIFDDKHVKMLVALYMMARVIKIVLDVQESKGRVTEKEIHSGFLIAFKSMLFFFAAMYFMDSRILPDKEWHTMHWFFGMQN